MLTELAHRLRLPTPAFLKKVQKRAAVGAGSFLAFTVLLSTLSQHAPSLPSFLATAAGYATAFLGGLSACCSLAVEDPAQIPTTPVSEPIIPLS